MDNSIKSARRFLHQENRKWDNTLKPVPPEEWPPARAGVPRPTQIMRSKEFLVQIYEEKDWTRLSICRTALDKNGGWKTGIDWETMQRLKAECGYRHKDAVEVFPKDEDIVNVANMRHMFVVNMELPFVWRAK